MARSRVSFSNEEQSLEQIAEHHADVQTALYEYFDSRSAKLLSRYAGEHLAEARQRALAELDLTSSLSVLSAVEAVVRIDYLDRVYARRRGDFSRAMRNLHKEKGHRARLSEDLIALWRDRTDLSRTLLGTLVRALEYRHWLAHGRYWTLKLVQPLDFQTVYSIAEEFTGAMADHRST